VTVAEALESVYEKVSGVLTMVNGILDGKMVDEADTFYDLPDRIARITGADEIIDGTATKISSLAENVQMYKFYHNDALQSASLPLATSVGECAFSDCTNLTEINLPVTTSIGRQAFTGTGIVTADMPAVTTTGGSVFAGCASLKTAKLPLLRIVEAGVFYDCAELETVDLTNVSSISANSFAGCKLLKALIIRRNGLCSLASARAFEGSGIANGTGFIYVPQELDVVFVTPLANIQLRNK